MVALEAIPQDREVYCFELDDVLFPRADYLLQVYYLFSNFVEFTDGSPASSDLTAFMKNLYVHQGEGSVFSAAQEVFGFDVKYKDNFSRLQVNAQLPLKLLLFKEVEDFIFSLFEKGKIITILTNGNPVEQLNKLKHVEWGNLSVYKDKLKVYFVDELRFRHLDPVEFIAEDCRVAPSAVYVVD